MADGDALAALVKKRWRAWLRAIHRDVGYLSIGFTIIYAISGIAQNHIKEWGDVSYRSSERTLALPAPATSAQQVIDLVKLGTPTETFAAGDEIRLTYANGEKVTAVGTTVVVQERTRRVFIGVANWLHTARGKPAWKYISDLYALVLIYLSISGILMIKGKLGWKWRGTVIAMSGIAVPVIYVALSGGPGSTPIDDDDAPKTAKSSMPDRSAGSGAVLKPLPPDDEPGSGSGSGSAQAIDDRPSGDPGSAVLKPLPPDEE